MAVTRREQEIIHLYESGVPIRAIASQMGLCRNYVWAKVRGLCFNLGPDVRHQREMMRGSRALLAAIRSERGR